MRYKDEEFGKLYGFVDSIMAEDHKDVIWIMYFGEACSKTWFAAEIVLASPTKHCWLF